MAGKLLQAKLQRIPEVTLAGGLVVNQVSPSVAGNVLTDDDGDFVLLPDAPGEKVRNFLHSLIGVSSPPSGHMMVRGYVLLRKKDGKFAIATIGETPQDVRDALEMEVL